MTFAAMRRDLQRRGLIDERYQLTDQGRAYCDRLLADLPTREARPCPPSKPRVRWSMRRTVDSAVN